MRGAGRFLESVKEKCAFDLWQDNNTADSQFVAGVWRKERISKREKALSYLLFEGYIGRVSIPQFSRCSFTKRLQYNKIAVTFFLVQQRQSGLTRY